MNAQSKNDSKAGPMPPFVFDLRQKIKKAMKTQTRRVIVPQPKTIRQSVFVKSGFEDGHGNEIRPRYPDGVRYLREPLCRGEDGLAYYRDDGQLALSKGSPIRWNWKRDTLPKMFMPSSLARYFYDWQMVAIQELWAISIEDIRAEGISHTTKYGPLLHDLFCDRLRVFTYPKSGIVIGVNVAYNYKY